MYNINVYRSDRSDLNGWLNTSFDCSWIFPGPAWSYWQEQGCWIEAALGLILPMASVWVPLEIQQVVSANDLILISSLSFLICKMGIQALYLFILTIFI